MNTSSSTPLNPAPSLAAQNAMKRTNMLIAGSLERQSTGLRIDRGADDPAGLVSSEQLRAQLEALEAETRALERAGSVASTADAALSLVSDQLGDAKALAVASANTGAMSDAELEANRMEAESIMQSVDRQLSTASFNGVKLFDGGVTLQAGGEQLDLGSTSSVSLGLSGVNAANTDELSTAVTAAAGRVNELRGRIGAFQANQVESQQRGKRIEFENVSAATSAIRDTDFAAESARFARARILGATGGEALRLTTDAARASLRFIGG